MTTAGFLVRRLLGVVGGLVLLSLVVFVGVDLLPGDPVTARLGLSATPERVAEARAALGLDRPVLLRYADWLGGLLHGDLGTSASGKPVTAMLGDRVGNSALLAGLAIAAIVPLSLGLGLAAGVRRNLRVDRVISGGALLLASVPEFIVASLLATLFALTWGLLPAVSLIPPGQSPLTRPDALVLPVAALVLVGTGYAVRVIRAATAAAVRAPHVEFLRLSGVPAHVVVRTAVLPAVVPVAAQTWLVTGVGLVGGAVLVEKVFGYPGMGDLLVTSTRTGDLPVVQALVLLLGAAMLVALLVADLVVRRSDERRQVTR